MADYKQKLSVDEVYRKNPNLKKVGVSQQWTQEQMVEWAKCSNDPVYFTEKYIKIVHVDHGLVPMILRDYQRDMILSMHENRKTTAVCARQSGKTTTYVAFLTHYILFQSDKTVGLLANKGDTAREILSRVQLAYEHLPPWMQQGVEEWNKGSLILENNSRILAAATSASAIRGYSLNVLVLDEAAFIEGWDEFFTSVYPTISSGDTTKMIQVSTPNGLNHFYKTIMDIREGRDKNNTLFEIDWKQVPGRDEKWRAQTLADLGGDRERFRQEYENQFLGSSGTLISGKKLKDLTFINPITETDGLRLYKQPAPDRKYAMVCDVSHGKGLDHSAFQVIDITEHPFEQVCSYSNNMITPIDYSELIYRVANSFNKALLLVESNDIGVQVCHNITDSYEYDNMLYSVSQGRAGKQLTHQTSEKKGDPGIKTSKTVKAVGCSMLKMIIEGNQLIINDYDTVHELSTFSKRKNSYEAEPGHFDDLVMCLVLFSWMTDQKLFKDYSDINTLTKLREKSAEDLSKDLSPFGFANNGLDEVQEEIIDEDGTHWMSDRMYRERIEREDEDIATGSTHIIF